MALAEPRSDERFTINERQFAWIAYAALGTLTLIIFTGAAVRLTGSGLGCPNWPKCTDKLLPPLDTHQMIEYGNRLVTGVVGIPCILAAVGAYRLRPFHPEYVRPALILPLGVLAQAIMGGLTVLLELQWQVVVGHYLISCLLLIAAAVLVWRIHQQGRPDVVNERNLVYAARTLALMGGAILVAGTFATAAGPHAGGSGTDDYVERLSAVKLDTLIQIHGHAAAVMGGLFVLLWLVAWRRRAGAPFMRALTTTCVLIALMGVIGLVQYHNELPSEIVWVHASLAAVTWLAMVWTVLAAGRPAS